MHVGYGVRCRVTSGFDWSDICQPRGEGKWPVLLRCLAVSADAVSNQTCRWTLSSHKTICCLRRNWSFLSSVISQGKVVALDRWVGKWNHLSLTHRLATNYAKNYCNRTPVVKVIVENVVTCFLGDTVYIFKQFYRSESGMIISNQFPMTRLDKCRNRAREYSTRRRPLPTYFRSFGTMPLSPAIFEITWRKAYWGHHLDLSGLRDVIGHVIIQFPGGHFL